MMTAMSRNLLELQKHRECRELDHDRRNVGDRAFSEHDGGAANGARGGSRDAIDERFDRSVVGNAMEVRLGEGTRSPRRRDERRDPTKRSAGRPIDTCRAK